MVLVRNASTNDIFFIFYKSGVGFAKLPVPLFFQNKKLGKADLNLLKLNNLSFVGRYFKSEVQQSDSNHCYEICV